MQGGPHASRGGGPCPSLPPIAWTSAVAQSFKRACASFGLGRYLYSLPRLWAEYDPQKKALKAPQTIVERMYQEARM